MLNASIKLLAVDWKALVEALMPSVTEYTQKLEHPPLPVMLLNKLEAQSAEASCALLAELSDRTRNELICCFLNAYRRKIIDSLNAFLKKDPDRYPVRGIAGFRISRDCDENLIVRLEGIYVDYLKLLPQNSIAENAFVKMMAKLLHGGADWAAEAALKQYPNLYNELTERLQTLLEAYGLTGIRMQITIDRQSQAGEEKADPQNPEGEAADANSANQVLANLSAETQEEIVEVLAKFVARAIRSDDNSAV